MERLIRNGCLLSLALHVALASGADGDRTQLDDEYLKQQQIYQTQDEGLLQSYVTDRALSSYALTLPAGFTTALANLGPSDRWLDIGAGQGYAILDYYSPKFDMRYAQQKKGRGKKGRAVAISIEDRRTLDWRATAASLEPNQLRYFSGKSLREYSLDELGNFQMITDVYGGFSYTRDMSSFMTRALDILSVNGNFYTLLQDVRGEYGANEPGYDASRFLTEIAAADGSETKVCSWLKSISCVQVTCEAKDWKPVVETYTIHKTCNDVKVPELTPVDFYAGTPPWRRFRLVDRRTLQSAN
jgi:hypothetical protein